MKYKEHFLIIDKLVTYCCEDLQIQRPNKITLINTEDYTRQNHSFGGYIPGKREILVVIKGRNIRDICVTASHECYHMFQDDNGQLQNNSGEDGSIHENEANSYAGKTMRKFGRENPEIFFMSI